MIIKFNELQKLNKNHNSLIFWITEKKSILKEQFSSKKLKETGFDELNKDFLILNYSDYKNKKWYECINSSKFWGKPRLVVINRAFSTVSQLYKNIADKIDLIIHDECHSIVNETSQKFYKYILDKTPDIKCIGFTATPILDYAPYDNIISEYSIYSALNDKAILPPKIYWLKSDNLIQYEDTFPIIGDLIKDLPYKKIIVWTGMIKLCYEIAEKWNNYFKEFDVYVDTSSVVKNDKFKGYDEFESIENKAFLFCAAKHREGSDIKNLDGCIFLDYVEDRSDIYSINWTSTTFRSDGEKERGSNY